MSIHTPLDTSTAGALDAWLFHSVGWPLVVGLVLLACALLTRLPWATELGSDFYTQLWWQRQFRRSKAWIRPQFEDSVIRDAATFYPPLPACLYARLPERLVVPAGVLMNYSADAVSAFCIYAFMTHHNLDPATSLLSALLWLCLPILHPVNARLIGLGARTFGPLLHLTWLFGAYFALMGHWALGGGVMVLLGASMALSSQMGLQSMLLQASVISIAYLNPAPLIGAIGGIAVAASLGARDSLATKLLHIRWYLKHGRTFLASRNSVSQLLSMSAKHPVRAICYVVGSTTIGVSTVGFIGLLPIVLSGWPVDSSGPMPPFVLFCGIVAVAGTLGALMTLKGPLEVFGESERYLEYASPFLVTGAILLASNSGLTERLLLGLAISLFGVFLNLVVYRAGSLAAVMRERPSVDGVEEVRSALTPFGPRRIATSPMSLASKLSVALDDPCRYAFLHVLVCDRPSRRIPWPVSPGVYPYLDTRAEFLDRFGIDTVIVEQSHLHRLPEETGTSQLADWSRLTTPSFEIFTRSPVLGHGAGSGSKNPHQTCA